MQYSPSKNNDSTVPQFGRVRFTPEEKLKVQQLLQEKVGPEVVSFRPGPNESTRNILWMV
jgi:recombination DNA repair RAD52 pathway protein